MMRKNVTQFQIFEIQGNKIISGKLQISIIPSSYFDEGKSISGIKLSQAE